MASPLTSPAARELLTRAVKGIELRSSAEVVLAIRQRSGSYRHADLTAGIVAGVLALAFVLFAPWPFPAWMLFVFPVTFGAALAWLTAFTPTLRRLCTSQKSARAAVEQAAQATFFTKSVGLTRRATGVLVYISLLERQVHVIPDRAVVEAVPEAAWQRGLEALAEAVRRPTGPASLGNALERLGEALAAGLPRHDDDQNELPDEVDVT
jgi:putative membrane protein